MAASLETDDLKNKINLETAKSSWKELQPFFATGSTIFVSKELDLINVAHNLAEDNAQQIKIWMDNQQLHRVDDKTAQLWYNDDTILWTVVVKPWVLVQEI